MTPRFSGYCASKRDAVLRRVLRQQAQRTTTRRRDGARRDAGTAHTGSKQKNQAMDGTLVSVHKFASQCFDSQSLSFLQGLGLTKTHGVSSGWSFVKGLGAVQPTCAKKSAWRRAHASMVSDERVRTGDWSLQLCVVGGVRGPCTPRWPRRHHQ